MASPPTSCPGRQRAVPLFLLIASFWFHPGVVPVAALRGAEVSPDRPGAAGAVAPDAGPVTPDAGPTPGEIAAVEERGRRIALYFEAVREAEALARGAGHDLRPDRVLVVADRDSWRVIFLGNVEGAGAGQGIKIQAEVPFNPQVGELGAIRIAVPPRSAPAAVASHGRALEVAEAAAAGHPAARPPFESSVFREADGTFTVYLKSKGDDPTLARFGGDLRIRVAPTGRQRLDLEALHGEPVTVSRAPRAAGAPTMHEHGPGDLPSPTDVAEIVRDPSLAPHLVLTPRRMFRIDAEGKVLHLGPRPGAPAPPAPTPGPGRP